MRKTKQRNPKVGGGGHWSTNPGNDRYKRLGEGLVDGLKLFAGLEEFDVYHSDVSWRIL